jgi:hypothetical protein
MKRKRTAAAAHSVMVMVHPNAAAIDIGATMHMAAVGADRTSEPVRCFGTFTTDLICLCLICPPKSPQLKCYSATKVLPASG